MKQKAELQQELEESIITVRTKRKHKENDEHGEDDDSLAASESQSSKRSEVGIVPDTTSAVTSDRNQAGNDDVGIIMDWTLHERALHSMLMKQLRGGTRRELVSAKARNMRFEQRDHEE